MRYRFLIFIVCGGIYAQQPGPSTYSVDLCTRPRVNALVDERAVNVPLLPPSAPSVCQCLLAWAEQTGYWVIGSLVATPLVNWSSRQICPHSGLAESLCVQSIYPVGTSVTIAALAWLVGRIRARWHVR